MTLTEEEAKTKWCPQLTGPNNSSGTGNVCIASACMAWRWAIKKGDYFYSKGGHLGATENVLEIETVGQGYCGKAGKP